MNTDIQAKAPEKIFINPINMQVVGEGYPNAVEYAKVTPTPHRIREYDLNEPEPDTTQTID